MEACGSANSAVMNSMKSLAAMVAPTAKGKGSPASGAQEAGTLLDMKKNQAAVSLGKRRAAAAAPGEMAAIGKIGGEKGGPARAKAMTAKRRKEIAKKAAAARWGKTK